MRDSRQDTEWLFKFDFSPVRVSKIQSAVLDPHSVRTIIEIEFIWIGHRQKGTYSHF
jgi:hypothetical protein